MKPNPENIVFRPPPQPPDLHLHAPEMLQPLLGQEWDLLRMKLFIGSLEMKPLLDHMPSQEHMTYKQAWKPSPYT